MIRSISTWLLAPLVAALLLMSGCSSSSSSGSGSAATTTTSSTAAQTATSATTTTAPPATTGSIATTDTSSPHVKRSAISSCKESVHRLNLDTPTRTHVENLCEKSESDAPAARREAAEEGCRELINASPGISGSAKQRALAACKNVKPNGAK